MRWTRRKFIASSASATLVSQIEPAARASGVPFDAATEQRLRTVMDEIIPQQGDMPSASEAGGVAYFTGLLRTEPEVAASVLAVLQRVDKSVPALEALRKLEQAKPLEFAVLRDFVYEAYYTQPQIWKRIGYQFYGTDHRGPHMKPFDEAVLAQVRTKPKFYREA